MKCPQPPPLPPNYVCRQHLLDEMSNKLCQSTIDSDSYGVSLAVTGAGGFGKTSIVTTLCHHPVIKENFRDGVVFVELGPQATDPSIKLSQLYHLLTGQYLKQGDINHTEQELNQLTSQYCRNLLVIVDDVWHVEDAEPIVKAFSNCRIVLTTRMNDIEQFIPTKQVVSVGPMEQSEAISLLTSGVIDISQLSQEDMSLLDELVQDVHLWPLLLSLIRGQLSHNLKQHKLCYHAAIQSVQASLHDKGLIAFDKNNIERSRKYAVKTCMEVTLQLLKKPVSDKLKSLLLYTGIGTSLQTAVLHNLWKITEHEAREVVYVLWTYGLVQFTDMIIPPFSRLQNCVEVHVVISQYIIGCMDSEEAISLSPFGGLNSGKLVCVKLCKQFLSSYGIFEAPPSSNREYLTYKLGEIEVMALPYCIKHLNMISIIEPHRTIALLQRTLNASLTSPNIASVLPTLNDEIKSLIDECHKILHDGHKLCRTLNQNFQRCVTQSNYHNLIQTVETHIKKDPIGTVAQQAITILKKIIPYSEGKLLDIVIIRCEYLQMQTPDYNFMTLEILPLIKLHIKELQLINTSLQSGSHTIEAMMHYFLSGKHDEEAQLSKTNRFIKLQEVAPIYVRKNFNKMYN